MICYQGNWRLSAFFIRSPGWKMALQDQHLRTSVPNIFSLLHGTTQTHLAIHNLLLTLTISVDIAQRIVDTCPHVVKTITFWQTTAKQPIKTCHMTGKHWQQQTILTIMSWRKIQLCSKQISSDTDAVCVTINKTQQSLTLHMTEYVHWWRLFLLKQMPVKM